MDPNERANLPNGGSQTVEPSTELDNSDDYSSFWEPEDDEDGVSDNPAAKEDETGGETDEVDNDQEAGEDDEDADGNKAEDGEPSEDAKLDETVVTLPGGDQVPVKELKLGYMRLNDYRAKTQNVANQGRALQEMSGRVTNTAAAIAQFLINQLPPEPSRQLAIQNPAEYTRQRAMYDTAAERVEQVLAMADAPKQVAGTLTQEQRSNLLREESVKLAEAFPETATEEGRETFFQNAFDTARDLGFTDDEMQEVTDHRVFRLAHYARLGLKAEAAKKKAMQKVNNAPPPTPRGRTNGGNAQQVRQQKDAIARLDRTGSLRDALKVDWE